MKQISAINPSQENLLNEIQCIKKASNNMFLQLPKQKEELFFLGLSGKHLSNINIHNIHECTRDSTKEELLKNQKSYPIRSEIKINVQKSEIKMFSIN